MAGEDSISEHPLSRCAGLAIWVAGIDNCVVMVECLGKSNRLVANTGRATIPSVRTYLGW